MFLEFKTNAQPPRGPGFWKFNCSLLEDCDYTEKMAHTIPQFIERYEYLDDKGLLRENKNAVKMEIRSFTISFAKVKAKKSENHEKTNKLERISLDRARGVCIRSKVRWHEFG